MPPSQETNSEALTPFSTQDRDWLEAQRREFAALRPGVAGTAFVIAFPAALAALAGMVVAGVGLWVFGSSVPVEYKGMVKPGVAGAAALVAVVLGVRGVQRRNAKFSAHLADMDRDIAEGFVRVETFQVEGVKVLREVEHGAYMLCLRLSDGRNLMVYDYGSYPDGGEFQQDALPTIDLRRTMRLVTYPKSGVQRYEFSGETVEYPATIELSLGPDEWPEDLEELRVPWEGIEAWAAGK